MAQSFKEILAWQAARELTANVYSHFKTCHDFGFRDQIQRASVSIMNNVAEGYGRRGDKLLRNYLLIAKGSAAEVESMLIIAHDLDYLNLEDQQMLLKQSDKTARLLAGFIKKLSALDS